MIFRRDEEDFHSVSLWKRLTAPFRTFASTLGELVDGGDAMPMNESFVSRVMGFVWLPFRLLVAFGNFMIQSWTATRSGKAFVRSLPVLLVLFGFFGVLLVEDFVNTEGRSIASNGGYLARQRMLFPDTPEDAEIFAQKLVEIKPDEEQFKYDLAITKEAKGETATAFDIMTSISPESEVGFANGHVWLSQYYARTNAVDFSEEERDAIVQKHLNFAVQAEPENQFAQMNLANMFVKRAGRFEKDSEPWLVEIKKAVVHLTAVANGDLTLTQISAVPAMAELRLEYEPKEVVYRRLAAEIIRLEPIARRNADTVPIWLGMIRCAVLMKEYPQALEIVQRGYQAARSSESKRQILQTASQIYLSSTKDFDNLADLDQYKKCINGLSEAIRVNPIDRVVCLRLLDFIGKNPATQNQIASKSEVNEKWLRDSVVGSRIPGVIHALLGMHVISKGNVEDGAKHWKIAKVQFPSADLVINNLLFVATSDRSERFDHLLDMITLAIEMFPDQLSLYQTRGIYLRDQNRYQEAIEDLKVAIEKMPKVVTNHKILMDCYAAIGDQENVQAQEKILELKLSELDSRQRKTVKDSMKRLDQRE